MRRVDGELGLPVPTFRNDHVCPHCRKVQNLASNIGGGDADSGPQDGDLTFCIDCQGWGVFDSADRGGIRKPTSEELEFVAKNEHCMRAEKMARARALPKGNA